MALFEGTAFEGDEEKDSEFTNKYDYAKNDMIDWMNNRPKQWEAYKNPKPWKDFITSNLKGLKYYDPMKTGGSTRLSYYDGAYNSNTHNISFKYGKEPTKELVAHETAHGSNLAQFEPTQKIMDDIHSKDNAYKDFMLTNEDADYYGNYEEQYAGTWEIREHLGLKPTDIVTEEMIKNIPREERWGLNLFKSLEDKSIVRMLNELVDNSSQKSLYNGNT
jgi:hypothetical protein